MAEGTKKIIGTILILLFLGGGLWFLSGQLKRTDEEQPEEGGEKKSAPADSAKINFRPGAIKEGMDFAGLTDEMLLAEIGAKKQELFNLKTALSDQIRAGLIKVGSRNEQEINNKLLQLGAYIKSGTTIALKRSLIILPSPYDAVVKQYIK